LGKVISEKLSDFNKEAGMVAEQLFYCWDQRKISVESGDIPHGYWELRGCVLEQSPKIFDCHCAEKVEKINLDNAIAKIELKSIKDPNQAANVLGVGAGAVLGLRFFGLLGAIGGALAGQALCGNRTEIAATVHLTDGRSFEATMEKNLYERLKAIAARNPESQVKE
jgi:hypothetical protein